MGFAELMLIAVSLAMDAFSVAVTDGITVSGIRGRDAVRIGAFFGVFQALMPCIGWLLGSSFINYIRAVDHWLAFALLMYIGINMIYESLRSNENCSTENERGNNALSVGTLAVLALATSVDALAVGITFATVGTCGGILFSAGIIGAVAFVFSVCGVYMGRRFGRQLGKHAEIAGGAVLAAIGVKILIEHLFF